MVNTLAQLQQDDIRRAFQDLCVRLPKGVFYRRGSFIAFTDTARDRWLDTIGIQISPEFRQSLSLLLDILTEKGFRGDAPASASGRVGDMNRFRQLLGALSLALEISKDTSAPSTVIERWFEPPPWFLLGGFDPQYLRKLNPPLAMRAATASPPPDTPLARTVEDLQARSTTAIEPLLIRRHMLFWFDPETRALFDTPKPEAGFPPALEMKLASVRADVDGELEGLREALTAKAPHNANALVFHMLAWIAWSEPVERSPGRPNPGFAPLNYFIHQLCRRKARQVRRKLPAYAPRAEEDIALELVTELVLMCQADRFRTVINLNAGFRAALDRLGKNMLTRARKDPEPTAVVGPMDWLVSRFSGTADILLKVNQAEQRAELQTALGRIWEALREQLAQCLEESNPKQIRLSGELREMVMAQAPALLVALSGSDRATLVRWYYLDALGFDDQELTREIKMRDLWLGDDENRRWLDDLKQAPLTVTDQRRALAASLERRFEETGLL